MNGEDGGLAVAQPGIGGKQNVADGHAALRRGVGAVVDAGKRCLRPRAGVHRVEVVHKPLHCLIGGAVGRALGPAARGGNDALRGGGAHLAGIG
ncbi:hypothetical protein SDC9_152692 [bioreactor metagenome]|uniref:Uncharacterized protein n=1 Tax=bioreactor metagenome TaxID=1076179 RepID=A0A645EW36_9ZZZZ